MAQTYFQEICCYVCLFDQVDPPNLANTTVNGTAVCLDHMDSIGHPPIILSDRA